MRKKFYLFRHGETDWNLNRRLQGNVDIPLNESGRVQAMSLQRFFDENPVDVMLSSDLSRAVETARIAKGDKDIPILLEPRLREMNLGAAEGLTIQEVNERFGDDVWKTWMSLSNDPTPCFPNGESKAQHLTRLISALNDFLQSPDHLHLDRIGVATHGGSLRRLIHHFLPELTAPTPISNCIVYEMSVDIKMEKWTLNPQPLSPLNR